MEYSYPGTRYFFLEQIVIAAVYAIAMVLGKAMAAGHNFDGRGGGYFSLREYGFGAQFAIEPMPIGAIEQKKIAKYTEFSGEKSGRLMRTSRDAGHELSWQSRNPENNEWGGAVKGVDSYGNQFFFSFSGLPEYCDEAAMLLTAVLSGCMTMDHARELASTSGNNFFLDNEWPASITR